MNGPGLDELCRNAGDVAGIDVLNQCTGKAVFHPEQNANFLHGVPRGETPAATAAASDNSVR